MIKEALEYLVHTSQKAREVRDLGLTPDGRKLRFDVAGEIKELIQPPELRDSRVHSLADLIAYTSELSGPSEEDRAVVWYSRGGVVLILDDDDRRDRVMFLLEPHETFGVLWKLNEEPATMDQRGFIRLLRDLGVDAALVAPFRRLDWATHVAAVGESAPGRDRLGKDVQASVAGTGDLPEDLIILTPVYRQLGEQELVQVRCRIETFPLNQRLQLRPFPGEIDAAFEHAMASIRERLCAGLSGEQRIYYGTP